MAYTRLSGKGQEAGDGVERQKIAIEKYAAANGIEIVAWFHDTQTGKDEWTERAGWSAMVSALNGVRTILVEKLDRVARVVLVQELICRDLKKRDIRLITSAGDDTDDEQPERVMFRQMLAVFASYERTMIVIKLRGARQRKKEATGRCEGRKPYGHRPGEGEVLQRIIGLSKEHNASDIARILNAGGVKPRGGIQWYPMVIARILKSANS